MGKIRAAITGVGGYVPNYVLTNAELETMVDTNDDWIRTRTGIRERRILKEEGMGTSELAVQAIKDLLEKTNTDPLEVDFLLCATTTPDQIVPDTGSIIQHKAGLKNAFAYDLNAACSGFIFALTTASKFVESGSHKKVIVVGADKMSSIINYEDRATCILFGDGAGAVLLEPREEYGIHDTLLKNDGAGVGNLYVTSGGSSKPTTIDTVLAKEQFVVQNGRPVFKAAVAGMSDVVQTIISRNNMSKEDVRWLVPHQANRRIIESVARMADFPMEKVMVNIHKYGNTTAATIPLCLWDYENQIQQGDNIVLTAFGGGYTWGSVYLKWAY